MRVRQGLMIGFAVMLVLAGCSDSERQGAAGGQSAATSWGRILDASAADGHSAGVNAAAPAVPAPNPTPLPTGTPVQPTPGPADSETKTVSITLPALLLGETDLGEVIKQATEQGITGVQPNADGSLTYDMPATVHKQLLEDLAAGIQESAEELKTGERFPSIKKLDYNKEMTEFTMVVDKAAYIDNFDGISTLAIGWQGMIYQAVAGAAAEEIKVTINVKDQSTGELVETIVYPDAFNN